VSVSYIQFIVFSYEQLVHARELYYYSSSASRYFENQQQSLTQRKV